MADAQPSTTLAPAANRLVKPKTRKGKRFLEKRAPKLVDSVRFTRNNEQIKPFEAGGEASLEYYCNRCNCSMFALGTHTKKRPHNLVLGRLFDFHLYDAIELGVDNLKTIHSFGKAAAAQAGNKPCMLFIGSKFETVPQLGIARNLLLDFFRGVQVEKINLAGLDRVMLVVALDDNRILIRQYHMTFKKTGTKVPRAALVEMGPAMDLTVRRVREAPADLAKEAMQQPKLTHKVKNVSTDALDGKVGRIYMPKQSFENMALNKMKGLKRERRLAASKDAASKSAGAQGSDEASPSKKRKVQAS